MHDLNNAGSDTARSIATAVSRTLADKGIRGADTFVLDARGDEGCVTSSTVTLVLPECFGSGDVEVSCVAFLETYIRSAQMAAQVVSEAESIAGSA